MDFLTLPQTPSLSGVGKGRGAPASRLVPFVWAWGSQWDSRSV